MKVMRLFVFVVIVGVIASGIAAAGQDAGSLDRGKALFNDPKLGTTGKSCNDCHQNGKGLQNAASEKDLGQIVNGCITQNLKGAALDMKSANMQSLILYIKSFSQKKEGKKAPVGC